MTAPSSADFIHARQPPAVRQNLPREILTARVSPNGTVASELDRSIRVRFEGSGTPAERKIIAETSTAEKLLQSRHGDAFRQLIKAALQTLDAHKSGVRISSLTMLPDEHAARAVDVLHAVIFNTSQDFQYGPWIEPSHEAIASYTKLHPSVSAQKARSVLRQSTASQYVKETVAGTDSMVRFSSGLNAHGNVILMPSQSRVVLASIGAYRMQPGDQVTALPPDKRTWYASDAYRTIVHELQHTVTPAGPSYVEVEHQRVLEEATATLLEGWLWQSVRAGAGADLQRAAAPPRRGYVSGGVAWDAWNNGRLPDAPKDLEASRKARYVGGPVLLRKIFAHAGMDLRTTQDRKHATRVLQGGPLEDMPRRLAQAVVTGRGMGSRKATGELADAITRIADGTAPVTLLDQTVREHLHNS